ncbi:hypothetical protein MKZ12_07145 [Paenibacillus sp. FSL R5-0713]|uniref:hypothetical protein n=1 Tax=Paenibacillus sp. FSL R5-0713 TaxID=2921655 RepID=UPI0030D8CBE0
MRKYHKLLATVSALLYTASIATAVEKQYLLAGILVTLSSAFMIGAVYAQRIYINWVLGRKNSHE